MGQFKSIEDPARVKEFRYLTIKERLMIRFMLCRYLLGKNWRTVIAKSDPFFATEQGQMYATSVAQAVSDPSRGNVDRIERVVVTMEKAAGIEPFSLV